MRILRASRTLLGVLALTGCTHASISAIPLEVAGVGTVYRYQGRANFPHQIAEADRMISADCQKRNGGRPVIVSLEKQDSGMLSWSNGQAATNFRTTSYGNAYSSGVSGTTMTTGSGSSSRMRNQNQEILYKCVSDGVS